MAEPSRCLARLISLMCSLCLLSPALRAQDIVYLEADSEALETGEPIFSVGQLDMSVIGPGFIDASEETPVYLRLDLPQGVVLAETLAGPGANLLFLAMVSHLDETLDADPGTVAVARWVAGESSLWVRVNSSSTTWVTLAGGGDKRTGDDDDGLPFAWAVGQRLGESSSQVRPFYHSDRANLPYNTRQIQPDVGSEAATELKLDLSGYTPSPGKQALMFGEAFLGSQGVETALDPDDIQPGQEAAIDIIPTLLFYQDDEPDPPVEPLAVDTAPLPVTAGDDCSQAGFFGINFDLETFEDAREDDPLFLRIELSDGVELCETLVNPLDPGPQFIYLAIAAADGFSNVVAEPEAVAVVRWIEGEEALWLRVSQSSEEWTDTGVGRVFFRLGLDASQSQALFQPLFELGQSNLPSNTLDPDSPTPTDTRLLLALDEGDINTVEPLVWADLEAFEDSEGVLDEGDPEAIDPGDFQGIFGGGPIAVLDPADVPRDPIGILVTSVLQEVNAFGSCEVTGDFSMEINGDVFPSASPAQPRYIRVRPRNGAVLCETLVAPATGDPIYLAMRLDAQPGQAFMAAAPTAVSIVRWVAGETDIWLKVTQATASWVSVGPVVQPPSETIKVRLSFGTSGLFSFEQNQTLVAQGLANMVANSTNPGASTSDDALDTLIRVNLSQSEMRPKPQGWKGFLPTQPTVFFGSTGVETAPNPGDINPGVVETPVVFGFEDVAQGELVQINQPVIVQGVAVQKSIAIPALDLEVAQTSDYKWETQDGQVITAGLSIPWDPIPTTSFNYYLRVTDRHGRSDRVRGTVLVNPDGVDLNNDGQNTLADFYVAAPRWPAERNILNLLTIRVDPPAAAAAAAKQEKASHD